MTGALGASSAGPVEIVIDDRERDSGVPPLLAADPGVRVEWRRLPLGDYIVDGRITVERKSSSDFVRSLMDGRLFRQVRRLKHEAERPVIIVQGRLPGSVGPQVDPAAVRGAVVSVAVMWYLPMLFAGCAAETAELLRTLARQAARHAGKGGCRAGSRPRRPDQRKSYILQGLPGVGPVTARRLLEHFGSVEKVVGAGREELALVRGIGADRANAIWEILR